MTVFAVFDGVPHKQIATGATPHFHLTEKGERKYTHWAHYAPMSADEIKAAELAGTVFFLNERKPTTERRRAMR